MPINGFEYYDPDNKRYMEQGVERELARLQGIIDELVSRVRNLEGRN